MCPFFFFFSRRDAVFNHSSALHVQHAEILSYSPQSQSSWTWHHHSKRSRGGREANSSPRPGTSGEGSLTARPPLGHAGPGTERQLPSPYRQDFGGGSFVKQAFESRPNAAAVAVFSFQALTGRVRSAPPEARARKSGKGWARHRCDKQLPRSKTPQAFISSFCCWIDSCCSARPSSHRGSRGAAGEQRTRGEGPAGGATAGQPWARHRAQPQGEGRQHL